MTDTRPTGDIVADLNLPSTARFCAASVAVSQYRVDASERLAYLDARLAGTETERAMWMATVASSATKENPQ